MRRRFASTACAVLCMATAHAGDIHYTTAGTPTCSSNQVARHDAVYDTQHRIDAIDPHGHFVGNSEADGELWRNWEPVDGYKHVMCGRQTNYAYFVAPWYSYAGEEKDTNQFFFLDSAFRFLLDNAIAWGFTDPDSVRRSQCGNQVCLEAEITYADEYGSNPWIPARQSSALDEKSVCAYGPWVADHGHDGRTEIHPTETLWWPMPVAADAPHVQREWRVVLLEDHSQRFSDRDDDFVPDMPAHLKPWAGFPRTAYVRYAFRVPPHAAPPEYLRIFDSGRKQHISTDTDATLRADATSGSPHTLVFNNHARFSIVEHQPDADLGVVFDETAPLNQLHDICVRADGTLQGYATLKSRFGSNSVYHAGFQELILQHTSGAPIAKIHYYFPPPASRTVNFNSLSSDNDGAIASSLWDFGDGTASTAATVSKTYAAAGTYAVTLTVADNEGYTTTAAATVTVQSSPFVLENGVPRFVPSRNWGLSYYFEVPAGASNLRFEMTDDPASADTSQEADLHVKFGDAPANESDHDCAPQIPASGNETCVMPTATPGVWGLTILPEGRFVRRNVYIKASYSVP